MQITFKDVGQGDSIIFEWVEEGVPKIGIIDCSKKGKKNPVLNHFINKKYTQIEFIILTHPHSDHYSGLPELLNYIEEKGYVIIKIAHTLESTHIRFWKYLEVGSTDTRVLSKLIRKFKELKTKGLLKMMDTLSKGVPVKINDSAILECLAPTQDEKEEYVKLVKMNADENIKEASQAANYLSTIFRLQIGDCYFLFTSDAEKMAFHTILNRGEYTFKGHKYVLCQLPHHGSENNHLPEFWKSIEIEKELSHATISAGQHKSYDHPAFEVVKHFHDIGYVVNCTNIVNGMTEYTTYLKEVTKNSRVLDGAGELVLEYLKSNDRVYVLQNNVLTLQT